MLNSSLNPIFSSRLNQKVELLKARRKEITLGDVHFSSPLLLAPMSSICNAPFRLLMEQLGAGGTVSELISCHGIEYKNEKTLNMLKIDPREQHVGIQLFGEDKDLMANAAKVASDFGPKFIDINMGCPVRKVVTKGAGSALLQDTSKLGAFFNKIKSAIDIPLTIKIRIGWDDDNLNALEVCHIAKEEGVEFVAVHGRTRTQQYKGQARWEFLEELASSAPLPIIGNGDLHTATTTSKRLESTNCDALMLARGPLRNPFLFLESYMHAGDEVSFDASDYLEITKILYGYHEQYAFSERILLVQMRKHIIWFATGFEQAAGFRDELFKTKDPQEMMRLTEHFFDAQRLSLKSINHTESFMTSGHG